MSDLTVLLYGRRLGDKKSVLQWAVVIGVLVVILTFVTRVGLVVFGLLVIAALIAAWYFGLFNSLL